MKKRFLPAFLIIMLLLLTPSQTNAWTWTPLQVAIWEPVQMFPQTFDVYGLRLNLPYGFNQNMIGLDVGGLNVAAEQQAGVQMGLLNLSEGSLGICAGLMNYTNRLGGLQVGLLNTAQNSSTGLQAAALMNLADSVQGFQVHFGILGNGAVRVDGAQFVMVAGYNLTDDLNGLQFAMFGFNYAAESVSGTQIAMLYNYAKKISGLQLGLVNACETLSGVQIGLVNIIWQEPMFIMPVLNFRF